MKSYAISSWPAVLAGAVAALVAILLTDSLLASVLVAIVTGLTVAVMTRRRAGRSS